MEKNNSAEDYLESILRLHKKKGFARSVDVAKELGVTRPSVSSAMKKLREKEMIYFSDRGHIFFTDAGKAIAEEVYKKHLLIKKVLLTIRVNEKNAAREAADIEHVISDETYECLSAFYDSYFSTVKKYSADSNC